MYWQPFIKESFASFFVVLLAGATCVGGISEFVDVRTRRAWHRKGWFSLMNHRTQQKHEKWDRKNGSRILSWIGRVLSTHINQLPRIQHGCLDGVATSMRRDAGSNPAWDINFFRFRDMCRKPPVSYVHLSIIVSDSLLTQKVFILLVD